MCVCLYGSAPVVLTHVHMRVYTHSVRVRPCLCCGSARPWLLPLVSPAPAPISGVGPFRGRFFGVSVLWGLPQGCLPSLFDLPPCPPQSFARIKKWLEHVRSSPSLTILAGGKCDDSVGYFVEPCIVESKDPQEPIMKEVTGAGSLGSRGGQSHRSTAHTQFSWRHSPVSQMRP